MRVAASFSLQAVALPFVWIGALLYVAGAIVMTFGEYLQSALDVRA